MGLINLPTQVKVEKVAILVTADYIDNRGKFTPGYHIYGESVDIDNEGRLREVLRQAESWRASEAVRDDRRNVQIVVKFTSVLVPIEEVLPVGGDTTITWTD